ncbi:extensin [Iris pallida]|uniref:Extensin n=1 Tax=Iris pallida TaxID=29817 RepID=A0AAX6EFE7_IRIPA|nr:extensin [Iris pallida]
MVLVMVTESCVVVVWLEWPEARDRGQVLLKEVWVAAVCCKGWLGGRAEKVAGDPRVWWW